MVTTNPEEAAKLRAKYTHFRILVIGRANAGKTTLLKRVCNTEEDPVYSRVRYPLHFIP
jgi:GTPase SAR1 family protein